LGGVNPNGGFGKLTGTVLASMILQVISTGFNLMRMDPFVVTATWGAIIILVLFGKEIVNKIFVRSA
ncbi:MAG: ABC transporter permease, partial [Treponema maltophilum]